jgi:hypothetical protein
MAAMSGSSRESPNRPLFHSTELISPKRSVTIENATPHAASRAGEGSSEPCTAELLD